MDEAVRQTVIEAALAARLEVSTLQTPVEHLVVEGQLAHVRHKAQLAVLQVQHDETERFRVPIEEELISVKVVVVTQLQQLALRAAAMQLAESAERESLHELRREGEPAATDVQDTKAAS